jgi:hypothetical protein
MPEIDADPPSPFCSPLLSDPESRNLNYLVLIPSCLARDARGRFAKGSSGNPGGRPRGIKPPPRQSAGTT